MLEFLFGLLFGGIVATVLVCACVLGQGED